AGRRRPVLRPPARHSGGGGARHAHRGLHRRGGRPHPPRGRPRDRPPMGGGSAEGLSMAFDAEAARAEFPILSRQVNGHPLVYLDSAASAQKPRAVIAAMTRAMEHSYANVHRGLHTLANEITEAYEAARKAAAGFIGAGENEVVFTKGGTEAINLVAAGLSATLKAGDEILLS